MHRAGRAVTEMTPKVCQPAAVHTAKCAFKPTVFKRLPSESICSASGYRLAPAEITSHAVQPFVLPGPNAV